MKSISSKNKKGDNDETSPLLFNFFLKELADKIIQMEKNCNYTRLKAFPVFLLGSY